MVEGIKNENQFHTLDARCSLVSRIPFHLVFSSRNHKLCVKNVCYVTMWLRLCCWLWSLVWHKKTKIWLKNVPDYFNCWFLFSHGFGVGDFPLKRFIKFWQHEKTKVWKIEYWRQRIRIRITFLNYADFQKMLKILGKRKITVLWKMSENEEKPPTTPHTNDPPLRTQFILLKWMNKFSTSINFLSWKNNLEKISKNSTRSPELLRFFSSVKNCDSWKNLFGH